MLGLLEQKRPKRGGKCLALLHPLTGEPDLPYEDNPQDYYPGSRVLRSHQATFDALLGSLRESYYDVVHFDCHGLFNIEEPLQSYISLSSGDPEDPQSYPLYARDVFSLRVSSPLVVLAACETGRGMTPPGDEAAAMVRAFFYAGTSSLITTLWAVDDESASQIFSEFYQNLTDEQHSLGRAQALAKAQRSMKAIREHPYYWAAPMLWGHWD
jgi:CHAT domain-containing protein